MRWRRNARDPHLSPSLDLKAPVLGKEVERTRKIKKATSELQREVTPIAEEELETKEGGGGGGGGGWGLKIT